MTGVSVQATLPNQMHAQLTELNGLKGNVGKRCIIMGLISSQVGVCECVRAGLCTLRGRVRATSGNSIR
jgi:hypothetical protein